MLVEAGKACLTIEGYQQRVTNLRACIHYEQGDTASNLLSACHVSTIFIFNHHILMSPHVHIMILAIEMSKSSNQPLKIDDVFVGKLDDR
jgi:hypothetical protein